MTKKKQLSRLIVSWVHRLVEADSVDTLLSEIDAAGLVVEEVEFDYANLVGWLDHYDTCKVVLFVRSLADELCLQSDVSDKALSSLHLWSERAASAVRLFDEYGERVLIFFDSSLTSSEDTMTGVLVSVATGYHRKLLEHGLSGSMLEENAKKGLIDCLIARGSDHLPLSLRIADCVGAYTGLAGGAAPVVERVAQLLPFGKPLIAADATRAMTMDQPIIDQSGMLSDRLRATSDLNQMQRQALASAQAQLDSFEQQFRALVSQEGTLPTYTDEAVGSSRTDLPAQHNRAAAATGVVQQPVRRYNALGQTVGRFGV